ncbi:MAG: hypothetical protein H7Y04_05925 [Verrucomicrobia bacterium]|nr:hypothetical protein [Cytophagales bacterium]
MKKFIFAYLICITLVLPVFSQNPDEFKIEDLLAADSTQNDELTSDLVLRFDYSSKTLTAGRDFGVQQYALSPSLTYFHKSGLALGVTGNWYSESDPKYSMTDLSISYTNAFGFAQSWLYSISYDRFLFNPDSEGLLKNVAGLYTNYDFGFFNIGLSYSLLFSGEETAHRINPAIAGYFVIKEAGFIDKITFAPSISATIATSNIPFSRLPDGTFTKGQGITYSEFQQLKQDIWAEITALTGKTYIQLQTQYGREYRNFKNQTGSTDTFLEYIIGKGYVPMPSTTASGDPKQAFGLMSWNFALPIRFKVGNLGWGITYNYIIPRLLPDESYTELPNQSYFSANINYTFGK